MATEESRRAEEKSVERDQRGEEAGRRRLGY